MTDEPKGRKPVVEFRVDVLRDGTVYRAAWEVAEDVIDESGFSWHSYLLLVALEHFESLLDSAGFTES